MPRPSKASRRVTQSSRAGLIFPVARFAKKLKQMPQATKRVSKPAGVYLTSVIEYLMAEVIELAGNAARDNRHARISPRHLMLAIKCDNELNSLLKKVTIPGSGVIPNFFLGPPTHASPARPIATARAAAAPVAAPILNKPALEKKKSGSFKKTSKNMTVLSERTLPSGQKLTVVQADITDVLADAIVHPTNNSFYMGGEVGSAISRSGGAKVRNEVQELHNKHGNLAICGAAMSGAGDKMLCNNIIHVHSPHWDNSKQAERVDDLTRTVQNVFTLSETNQLKTIALPSISSGGNGYPKQLAAQTILRAINAYFKSLGGSKTPSSIKQVFFVLYDPESVGVYTSELGKLEI